MHLDQQAYDNFQPVVLKATQTNAPLVCVTAITGMIKHSMGTTRNCPRYIHILSNYPIPATEHLIWLCGENMYTCIPPHWQGSCAPYWIPKTESFLPENKDSDNSKIKPAKDIVWPTSNIDDEKS